VLTFALASAKTLSPAKREEKKLASTARKGKKSAPDKIREARIDLNILVKFLMMVPASPVSVI
jgi:hypothetical protein